jgi:ATP-dependent DNA helicase PIF1
MLFLTENMHLKKCNLSSFEYKELENFNNWILNIGNGNNGSTKCTQDYNESVTVGISEEFLI